MTSRLPSTIHVVLAFFCCLKGSLEVLIKARGCLPGPAVRLVPLKGRERHPHGARDDLMGGLDMIWEPLVQHVRNDLSKQKQKHCQIMAVRWSTTTIQRDRWPRSAAGLWIYSIALRSQRTGGSRREFLLMCEKSEIHRIEKRVLRVRQYLYCHLTHDPGEAGQDRHKW